MVLILDGSGEWNQGQHVECMKCTNFGSILIFYLQSYLQGDIEFPLLGNMQVSWLVLSQGWCEGKPCMAYVPLTNHNQLTGPRGSKSWDKTDVVAVVTRASPRAATGATCLVCLLALLSPDQSFDCRPDHTGQQEQRCDQDVEEGEGGEGHRRRTVRLFEEDDVAHEGLRTEAHVRQGRMSRGASRTGSAQPMGRKQEGTGFLRGSFS